MTSVNIKHNRDKLAHYFLDRTRIREANIQHLADSADRENIQNYKWFDVFEKRLVEIRRPNLFSIFLPEKLKGCEFTNLERHGLKTMKKLIIEEYY